VKFLSVFYPPGAGAVKFLVVLIIFTLLVSCKVPAAKAPIQPVPKQEPITEELSALQPGEVIEEMPEEKALVFHPEPAFIPEETTEPDQLTGEEAPDQEAPVMADTGKESPDKEASVEPPQAGIPLEVETLPAPPVQAEVPPTVPPPVVPPTPVVPPEPVPPPAVPPVLAEEPEVPPPEELSPQEREGIPLAIPDMPFQPVSVIPEPAEKDLAYSRTVKAVIGQYIEIPFRGSGWVFLGEFGSRRGVSYDSRRMEAEGMTFIFHAEAEGTYSLKFNRQDFIHDHILNDYVKVIVEQPPELAGSSWANPQLKPERVYAAPRWPPAAPDPEVTTRPNPTRNMEQSAQVPSAQAAGGRTEDSSAPPAAFPPIAATPPPAATPPTAAAPATAPAIAGTSYADLLKNAQEEYNAGRIAGALIYLDQFMNLYPGGSDEAYWLYGQSLEANNEATRDIRLALDYYRRLVREFPQSNRNNEARRRIAYLERFYFNIQ
jgi:hypothetical protein